MPPFSIIFPILLSPLLCPVIYMYTSLPYHHHLAIDKVALLIGNKKYDHPTINHLVSPENDIRELLKLLEAPPLNFKVISLVNLQYHEMINALENLYRMLAVPGVYALFYYSGYGLSHEGKTYLVPVDAIPPLHCSNTVDTYYIGLRMKRRLSSALEVFDCCKIE